MMEKGKVVVVLINYNGSEYLERCVDSILGQNHKKLELVFIDNDSPGRVGVKLMHEKYAPDPRVTIVENTENLGYARAANQGIKLAKGRDAEFVAITNPDLVYEEDYFKKVVTRLNKDENAGAITGKIYKYDFEKNLKTDILDSTGLKIFPDRRVVDRGQGEIDEGKFDKEEEVFGVSGACPLYRIKALDDVKIMDEYFDADFFMYKEDVDLSWRLTLYGWKSIYYPKALAYHGRGTAAIERQKVSQILTSRKYLSKFQKTLSFRNHKLMVLKNDLFENRLQSYHRILPKKLILPFYVLFREPFLIKAWFKYLTLLPKMLKKRALIAKNKRRDASEMKKWFSKN